MATALLDSNMADSKTLVEEINNLKMTFTNEHQRLRIIIATAQEFKCYFIGKRGKRYVMQAYMSPKYPNMPAIWFAETEDEILKDVIHKINMASVLEKRTHITYQVNTMLKDLCEKCDVPLPSATQPELPSSPRTCTEPSNLSEEQNDQHESEQQNAIVDLNVKDTDEKRVTDEKNMQFLNRLRENLMQTKNVNITTLTSTKRLMNELSDVFTSYAYKNDMYTVDIVNDSIYEWNVKLKIIDRDSALYRDLQVLKVKGENEHIQLSMIFKENHPFEPPFVRIVYPIISGGLVLNGGAICMELLTKQGWSSAYIVESVIMQIAAMLSRGNTRVEFEATKNELHSRYSLDRAKLFFGLVSNFHARTGWPTPKKNDN